MTIGERFGRWRAREGAKLKPMPVCQRLQYILYYYKSWLLGLLVVGLFIGYIGDAVSQARKEVVLQGFFTNDDLGLFDATQIESDFGATLSLAKNQSVIFDDALYIDLGGGATEYSAASNSKLIAYMMTQELDFVVTTEAVLHHYEAETPMLDLEELLPEALLEKLEPYLYRYTQSDGTESCIALNMQASRFIAGAGVDSSDYVLFVPKLAPNPQQVCAFIQWAFPDL